MRLQTSNETLSTRDKVIGFSLAAFSMFVVGYTATRAFLNQPNTNLATDNSNLVIPHEATLWSDFGK
ncbi:hypothetical protein NIES4102_07410 [Chondrocystis sp. NIES-4102]|nr:hypothetical protein NIES4102_07410 [Chondrocystis sp. NIES-4102]